MTQYKHSHSVAEPGEPVWTGPQSVIRVVALVLNKAKKKVADLPLESGRDAAI